MSTDHPAEPPRGLGQIIGKGRVADVHAHGELALKLSHAGRPKVDAFAEAAILSMLEAHDLPTPRVHSVGSYGGRWGLAMDRVDGPTLGDLALGDPSLLPGVLDEMVRLQLRVHAAAEPRLRTLKARLADRIRQAPALDDSFRRRLSERLGGLPDGHQICHGDFHPFNIIGTPPALTIVDWLDASAGPPAADACRSYLLLMLAAPEMAEPYLERYASASGLGRDQILDWLPCLAAARLCEGTGGEAALLDLIHRTQ